MKRLLLPILIAFSGASVKQAIAQPTLTAASNSLNIGDQFSGHQAAVGAPEFTAAAVAGANQTWTFSSLGSASTVQAGVLSRATAPNPTSMPAANMVIKIGDEYAYYENSNNSLKEYGAYEATQSYTLENTDPAEKLRFPFTFNNTFSDTYTGSANLGGTIIPRVGTVTVTAEGYGTLVTPGGTYQNVLKIKTEEISNPATLYSENSVTYDWFQPGIHFPVLRITRRVTLLGTVHTGFYLSSALGTKKELATQNDLQLFPNPATSMVKVQFKTPGSEAVKLTLHNLVGQEIASLPYVKNGSAEQAVEINVAAYPKGIYLLKLQAGNQAIMKRLVIQ